MFIVASCNKKVWTLYWHLFEGFGYDWSKAFSTQPNKGTYCYFVLDLYIVIHHHLNSQIILYILHNNISEGVAAGNRAVLNSGSRELVLQLIPKSDQCFFSTR